jgi:hypothetical protein
VAEEEKPHSNAISVKRLLGKAQQPGGLFETKPIRELIHRFPATAPKIRWK